MRKAAVHRTTNETSIQLKLNLDGRGKARIDTGIRFFDHMLEQIARHGALDLDWSRAAIWTWTSTTPLKMSASRWAKR